MTLPLPSVEQVRRFWDWFASRRELLERNLDCPLLLRELDAQVDALAPIAWELGPGRTSKFALTLSPGGSSDLLSVTQRIVEGAPRLEGWEFLSSKQPKEWDGRFSFVAQDGRTVEVDSRLWRHVLFRFPDGTFELDVVAPDLSGFGNECSSTAIEIALDGWLGEATRIRLIESIRVVERFSDNRPGTSLSRLPEQLSLLTAR